MLGLKELGFAGSEIGDFKVEFWWVWFDLGLFCVIEWWVGGDFGGFGCNRWWVCLVLVVGRCWFGVLGRIGD